MVEGSLEHLQGWKVAGLVAGLPTNWAQQCACMAPLGMLLVRGVASTCGGMDPIPSELAINGPPLQVPAVQGC